jgi:hypothetical protein
MFDPNKPFDVIEAAKADDEGFDPSQPHEVLDPVAPAPKFKQEVPVWESALRGAAQGGSLGFADELTAAGESALGSLGAVPDKTYRQALEESRKNYNQAEEDHPAAFGAGEFGGGVASTFIPGLNVAKGASLAKMAATAALTGGVNALGRTEATDVPTMASDAVKGALAGGVVGAGMYGVGKGVSKLLEAAKPASEALKSTKAAFDKILSPRVADDWDEFKNIALKNGINPDALPEAHKFGPDSLVTNLAKVRNEGALGEPYLDSFRKAQEETVGAVKNQIQKIGGGVPLSKEQAGNLIRKGYDQTVDGIMKQMDFTYRSAGESAPAIMELTEGGRQKLNTMLGKLENFARANINKAADDVQAAQAKGVLRNIGNIRKFSASPTDVMNAIDEVVPHLEVSPAQEGKLFTYIGALEKTASDPNARQAYRDTLEKLGGLIKKATPEDLPRAVQAKVENLHSLIEGTALSKGPYQDLVEVMQNIGKVAFKNKNIVGQIPPDVKSMRELYFGLSDVLLDSVDSNLGKEIGDQIRGNNKVLTTLFGDQSVLNKAIHNRDLGGEKVFDALISRGDSTQLEALKKLLPPEALQAVKGTYLDSLVKENPEGLLMFRTMINKLRDKNKQATFEHLFTPQEITDFGDILRFGDRFGNSMRSTSGSSPGVILSNLQKGMKSAVVNDYLLNKMKAAAEKKVTTQPNLIAPNLMDEMITKLGNASKYSGALRAAANRGGQAAAATAYVLQQRDPEFRKKMREGGGLNAP